MEMSLVTSKSSSLGGFVLNASPPLTESVPPLTESAPLVFSLSDPLGVEECWGSREPSRCRSGLEEMLGREGGEKGKEAGGEGGRL